MADDLEAFRRVSQPLEGRVDCMYVDKRGLVTCGVGNLIDPVDLALRLPWRVGKDGPLADAEHVRNAWRTVKRHGNPDRLWTTYARDLSDLRLSEATIDTLVDKRLLQLEKWIIDHWIALEEWRAIPADAQLGICLIGWACGADFFRGFPKFTRAVHDGDWIAAGHEGRISTRDNPGIIPRNAATLTCFQNAATVVQYGLDRDTLHYPDVLGKPLPEPPPAAETIELIPLELPDGWLEDLRKQANLDWSLSQ